MKQDIGPRLSCLKPKYTYSTANKENNINHHDLNIRKWIPHRFNEKGIDGIISKKHNHKQHKFDNDIEKQIVDITSANPRSFNLAFSTWSLHVLAGFLMNDLNG